MPNSLGPIKLRNIRGRKKRDLSFVSIQIAIMSSLISQHNLSVKMLSCIVNEGNKRCNFNEMEHRTLTLHPDQDASKKGRE